jgi:hypothetical protein
MPVKGTFANACLSEVGTSWETLYTCPVGEDAILIELDICNLLGSGVQCDVRIVKGVNNFHLIKDAPVPPGSTLQAVFGQKVVLQSTDLVQVKSSVVSSVDVIASIIEDVNS